jgi:hypothetical protein
MEIINKVAILISWPRELDMFLEFSKSIKGYIVIADDLVYTKDERFKNGERLLNFLNEKKIEYVLLSEVIGRFKYKVVFSTAEAYQEKVTYYSFFKYIYAISIGSFIQLSGLSKFFINFFSRPLAGGGTHAETFIKYPVERVIGIKTIRYPKGLDINKALYPKNQWRSIFDYYLCHSEIDCNLITDKFPEAKCIKIGYPKYNSLLSEDSAKNITYSDITSINPSKPLILWMPTLIKINGEIIDNIKVWSSIVFKLLDKFNVLIRPHPKLVDLEPEMADYLKELGFLVDIKKGRNLSVLYQSSDLVLADYGASVLSAVYMKKKLILLNSSNQKSIKWREERKYIDDDVRNDVSSFNINEGDSLVAQINRDIQNSDNTKTDNLKNKYFGNEVNQKDIVKIIKDLTS